MLIVGFQKDFHFNLCFFLILKRLIDKSNLSAKI